MEFLYSEGVTRPDIAGVSSGNPCILKQSLQNHVLPSFEKLKNLVDSDVNIIRAIIVKRFWPILNCDVDSYMAPNVNLLQESGVSELHIVMLFKAQPRAIARNLVKFKEMVEEVKDMGFNPLKISFVQAVTAMKAMSKSTWERKSMLIIGGVCFEEEILVAFGKNPYCIVASEDEIMRVMNFLVNKLDLKSLLIVKRPSLINMSLEK